MIVRAKLRVQRNARAMTVWVRIDKAQTEHNESRYPPIADIRADIVDGSEVPEGDKLEGDLTVGAPISTCSAARVDALKCLGGQLQG